MAQGMNKVFLLGHLGADPERKRFPDGEPYLRMRLATSEPYKDEAGNWLTRPEWHTVVFAGERADKLLPYLKKGDRIMVEGRVTTRAVDGDDGKKRYFTDIRARDIVLAGGPAGRDEGFVPEAPRAEAVAALN
jgi:single-strand DNA-binding protein